MRSTTVSFSPPSTNINIQSCNGIYHYENTKHTRRSYSTFQCLVHVSCIQISIKASLSIPNKKKTTTVRRRCVCVLGVSIYWRRLKFWSTPFQPERNSPYILRIFSRTGVTHLIEANILTTIGIKRIPPQLLQSLRVTFVKILVITPIHVPRSKYNITRREMILSSSLHPVLFFKLSGTPWNPRISHE